MSYNTITVSDFKAYFVRDFPYGADISLHILDADITRALTESFDEINHGLFDDQESFDIALNYLTAHNLVMNIRMSGQGLSGKFEGLFSSKGVGSVSSSYSIPSEVQENPRYSDFFQTNYGAKYFSIVYPCLIGNVGVINGRTQS